MRQKTYTELETETPDTKNEMLEMNTENDTKKTPGNKTKISENKRIILNTIKIVNRLSIRRLSFLSSWNVIFSDKFINYTYKKSKMNSEKLLEKKTSG